MSRSAVLAVALLACWAGRSAAQFAYPTWPSQPLSSAAVPGGYVQPATNFRSLDSEGFQGAVYSLPISARGSIAPVQAQVPAPGPEQASDTPQQFQPNNAPESGLPEMAAPAGGIPDEAFPAGYRAPNWNAWASVEALVATTRGVSVPALVTTGPVGAGAGAIGSPATVPLFGGRTMLDSLRGGVRTELGLWLDDSHNLGVAFRYYALYDPDNKFSGTGTSTNVVNVPQVFDIAGVGVQIPLFVSFPGLTHGTVSALAQTSFMGGDLSMRNALYSEGPLRVESIMGYRQMHLGDQLDADFRSIANFAAGIASISGDESVRTRNNFYGGQVGGIASLAFQRFTIKGYGVVALGDNATDVNFSYSRTLVLGTTPFPLSQFSTGGRVNYFGTVLDGGIKVGYQVTDHLRVTAGYGGMYWFNVLRAQQMFNLSPNLTNGTTYFYARMFSLGAELRF